jgi:hypothetical protein
MYRKLLIITCLISGVAFIVMSVALPTRKTAMAAFSLLLVGAGIIPIMSIGYAFSVELAYPMPEAIVNGTMISIALVWGTLQGFLDIPLTGDDPRYAMYIWSGTSFIAAFVAYFIKCKNFQDFINSYDIIEDLRRMQLDDVKNSEYVEEDVIKHSTIE